MDDRKAESKAPAAYALNALGIMQIRDTNEFYDKILTYLMLCSDILLSCKLEVCKAIITEMSCPYSAATVT